MLASSTIIFETANTPRSVFCKIVLEASKNGARNRLDVRIRLHVAEEDDSATENTDVTDSKIYFYFYNNVLDKKKLTYVYMTTKEEPQSCPIYVKIKYILTNCR